MFENKGGGKGAMMSWRRVQLVKLGRRRLMGSVDIEKRRFRVTYSVPGAFFFVYDFAMISAQLKTEKKLRETLLYSSRT